jgi:3-hydroxybutyryl-CoA dehydrogenase
VAIIGAGRLGRRLALAAASSGFRVLLEDVMPHNLHHAQEFFHQQLTSAAPRRDVPSSSDVILVSTIEDAVREADLVIDCVPDELESKLEIFWLLDRMAPPRTVLMTPTAHLSIADLAHCTYRPGKCIAVAVEADTLAGSVRAEIPLRTTVWTTAETIALVRDFWERLGFTPVFAPDPAQQTSN